MSEKLKELRERSQKRKKLLAQTVGTVNITSDGVRFMPLFYQFVSVVWFQLGVSSVSELRHALGASLDVPAKKQAVTEASSEGGDKPTAKDQHDGLVYTDSSTFLKVIICLR